MTQFPESDDDRRLRAALAALGREESGGAPARVESVLLAQLQRRRPSPARRLYWAVPLAAAAILLLAMTLRKQPRPPAVTVAIVAPAPEPPTPTRQSAPPPPVPAPKRAMRRPPPKQPAKPVEVETADADFVAVGAWQAIEPIERGSIVRVHMPNSALPSFGIPIRAERWNESIPADLMLAEDGSVRAVRFVSTKR